MFAPILATLLVSGPPLRSPDSETAERIMNEITAVLDDYKVSGYDVTVCVRNHRDVSISGRIDSIEGLKAVLDTVKPHADTLTLRIGVGRAAPGDPDAAELSLQRHVIINWTDGSWQQTLKVRPDTTTTGK